MAPTKSPISAPGSTLLGEFLQDDFPAKVGLDAGDSGLIGADKMRWFSSVAAALAAAAISHPGWLKQITPRMDAVDAAVLSAAAPRWTDWHEREAVVRERLVRRKFAWSHDLGRALLSAGPETIRRDPALQAARSFLEERCGRTVMVTGHRTQHLPPGAVGWVRSELVRVMNLLDPLTCVSGLARGVDTFWAQVALDQGRELVSYVPFPDQASPWAEAEQQERLRLLALSTEIVTVAESYQVWAFPERNNLMVQRSPVVVAVYDGKATGGTAHAFGRARKMKRTVVRIDPLRRTTTINRGRPQGPGEGA